MIQHKVEQGSEEWLILRLGIPTASEFSNIITPARGEPTKGEKSEGFQDHLICERIVRDRLKTAIAEFEIKLQAGEVIAGDRPTLGSVVSEMGPEWEKEIFGSETDWMRQGSQREQEAALYYSLQTGYDLEPAGFITNDEGTAGVSIDRFHIQTAEEIASGAKRRGVEIKSPAPHTHINYLLSKKIEVDKRPQIQSQIWVADLASVDIVSYCRGFPIIVIRCEPDMAYIQNMKAYHSIFTKNLEEKWISAKKQFNQQP